MKNRHDLLRQWGNEGISTKVEFLDFEYLENVEPIIFTSLDQDFDQLLEDELFDYDNMSKDDFMVKVGNIWDRKNKAIVEMEEQIADLNSTLPIMGKYSSYIKWLEEKLSDI